MEDQRTSFIERLRAIYIEVVGDTHAARTKLSPMGLHHEIDGKTPKPDGVRGPPADPAGVVGRPPHPDRP